MLPAMPPALGYGRPDMFLSEVVAAGQDETATRKRLCTQAGGNRHLDRSLRNWRPITAFCMPRSLRRMTMLPSRWNLRTLTVLISASIKYCDVLAQSTTTPTSKGINPRAVIIRRPPQTNLSGAPAYCCAPECACARVSRRRATSCPHPTAARQQ